MSLNFAEHGIHVHFFDPSESNGKALESEAQKANLSQNITGHKDYKSLCKTLGTPQIFIFSTTHGKAVDKIIDGLYPWLDKGAVIMDAGNEHWERTQRRQRNMESNGIQYIGMGVSGGYQSARHGPSISPGGSKEALDAIFPLLEKVAARDNKGRPCTVKLGPGGCGHFVKMIHNGIEHGMMTALCEAWGIMTQGLSMNYDEVADVFERWNKHGPLQNNFLVDIGSRICRTRDPKDGTNILANIRDKVVQDADDSEGTGTWSLEEAARLHVPAPTIAAAHMLRVASAYAERRAAVARLFTRSTNSHKIGATDTAKFVKDLETSVYVCFLSSFIQGLHVISKANAEENGWHMNLSSMLQLWRGGCIIQSDFIVNMLDSVYRSRACDKDNLLGHPILSKELKSALPALKRVVLSALESDAHVPVMGATLEYLKYSSSTDLPTSFQEAQLDFFGGHRYDLKTEDPGKPAKGKHHFEWRPARGITEEQ